MMPFHSVKIFLLVLLGTVIVLPVYGELSVTRVIDGDSMILSDGREVRLLGVDCPEFTDEERNRRNALFFGVDPQQYANHAPEAASFLEKLVHGRKIRTEIDPANAITHHHDAHGRFLAYLYLAKENLLVNAVMIHQGHCLAYRKIPFRLKNEFLAYEKDAKQEGRGIWS